MSSKSFKNIIGQFLQFLRMVKMDKNKVIYKKYGRKGMKLVWLFLCFLIKSFSAKRELLEMKEWVEDQKSIFQDWLEELPMKIWVIFIEILIGVPFWAINKINDIPGWFRYRKIKKRV